MLRIYSEPNIVLLEEFDEHTDFVDIVEYLLQYASTEDIIQVENKLIMQKLRLREK